MHENNGMNRAKFYQLALFPMNNGATNVYFVLILSYIATFGNKVLMPLPTPLLAQLWTKPTANSVNFARLWSLVMRLWRCP